MIYACTDNGFSLPPPPVPYNLMTGNLDNVHAYDPWAKVDLGYELSPIEPEAVHGRVLVQQQQGITTPTIHQSPCDELCLESKYQGLDPSNTSFQSIHLTPLAVATTKHPTVPNWHGTDPELQQLSPIQNYSSPQPTPARRNGLLVHSNKPSVHLTPELSNTQVILQTTLSSSTSFSSSSSSFRKHKQTTSPGLAPLTDPRVSRRFPTPCSSSTGSKHKPTTLPLTGPGTNIRFLNRSVFRSPVTGFYPNTEFLSPRVSNHFGPSMVCCSFETPHPKYGKAAVGGCQKVCPQEPIDVYDTRPWTRGRRVSSWIRNVARFRHRSAPEDTEDTATDDDSVSADKENGDVRPASPFVDVPFY